jgi:protein-disulfide isomerase
MVYWNIEELRPVPGTENLSCFGRGRVRFLRVMLGGLACLCIVPSVFAQDQTPKPAAEPAAVFAGQPIDTDQFPPAEQAQLQRMMGQVYAVKLRALHAVVDQKLIEAEAKKKGVSPDELFKSEVAAKVGDPTDEQVRANFESRQDLRNQSFDDVKDKVRKELKDVAIQKARMVYIQGLMQQALNDGELVILLSPPKVEVSVDPTRLRGDAKAPISIVEFSDFSCPFCRKAESTVVELLAKYPGKVNLGYRDFPLNQLHPDAQLAAEASHCAAEQGKFWEYHDLLFANPGKQDRNGLLEGARTLKLNGQQFDACLSSGRSKPQIDQDFKMGSSAGVIATPAFFINGVFVSGAQPAATFEKTINGELSAASKKHAGS